MLTVNFNFQLTFNVATTIIEVNSGAWIIFLTVRGQVVNLFESWVFSRYFTSDFLLQLVDAR